MKARPDIAFLVYDLRGSGVVRNVLRLARAARDDGLHAEIWVVRADGDLAQAVGDIPVVELGSRIAGLGRTAGSIGAVGAIARAIDARRPHIFFSAGNQIHLFATLGWRRARTDARADIRFVGRASNAVQDRIADRHGIAGWGRRMIGQFERLQYADMDLIIAVARELASDLHLSLGIPAERIEAIPNGVDVAQVMARATEPCDGVERGDDIPVIIGVGRLSRQKNFALLIRAFALLRAQRPARLAILGDGPEREKRTLGKLAEQLGVAGDVTLAGFQPNPWSWMARAGLFVLSSRWEGSSNALIEALACGCPVVATAIPTGVREVLEDGRFGALVPSDDAPAMAAAMAAMLDMAHADPAMRERQRAHAAAFGLDATLAAYVARFRALLGESRA